MVNLETKINIHDYIRELVLERKNRALIANSESSRKEFQFLFNFCFQNLDNDAKEIDIILDNLNQEEVIIMNDMLQSVLNLCREEWVGGSNPVEIINDPNLRKRCSLCNAPNNKWVFNIINKISGRKMNVGSTCIDHFPSITLKVGKSKTQIMREVEKQVRLQDITLKIPGIERAVQSWNVVLDDFDIIIPSNIEKTYVHLGENLKQLFDEYLEGKNEISIIDQIKEIMQQKELMLQKMTIYCDESRDKKYIATREIVNWLKRNDQYSVIEKLKETGFVTENTAPNIKEKHFIENIIWDINEYCEENKLDLKILGVDVDNNKFVIQSINRIILECSIGKFLTYFSWVVFNAESGIRFNLVNVFKACSIMEKPSQDIIINEIQKLLKGTNYSVSVNDSSDIHSNDIYIADRKINKVHVLNINKFINEYKVLAFGIKRITTKELVADIEDFISKTEHKTYTREELRELRKAGREFNKREK